ncbi:hypothetical protein ACUXVY_09875 [Chromobacterium haemolyticum]|uniref:hypothetical protein n=1 Tax=Chromobacterium haemolyticum TaxID=394935 RepID=UPI00405763A6
MNRRFDQFGSAAFFSAGAFLFNALVVLGWYVMLSTFYSSEISGHLLLWISAPAMLGLLDVGLSIYVAGRIAELRHKQMYWIAAQTGLVALVFSICSFLVWSGISGFAVSRWLLMPMPVSGWIFPFFVFSVALQTTAVSNGILKGYHKFRVAAICQFLNSTCTYGFSIILMLNGASEVKLYFWLSMASLINALIVSTIAFKTCVLEKRRALESQKRTSILSVLNVLIRGGVAIFPQQLPGIFFNHALRFLIAATGGIQNVTKVSLSFTIAARMHALGNSFLEVMYPLAHQLRENGISVKKIQLSMWKIGFPLFLSGTVLVCLFAKYFNAGDVVLILLFCAGTWVALIAAPIFHIANAMGKGVRISVISVGVIPSFVLVIFAVNSAMDVGGLSYGVAYFFAQTVFYFMLHYNLKDSKVFR